MKNILVYVEHRGGKILPASFQLLALARELAESGGGEAHACVIGQNVGAMAADLAAYGAQRVYTVDDAELALYRVLPFTTALASAVEAAGAGIVLVPTTAMGRDLASRLAARKRAALAVDCTEVKLIDGALDVAKTMFAGKLSARFRLDAGRLQVATVRSNVYSAREPQAGASAPAQAVAYAPAKGDGRVRILEIAATGSGVKDVTEADIVVSGGRALKSAENFKILHELAGVLDAAVGASRAACDAGYQPHTRQVGLTGKVVTPKLYIACGIDGAIQHLAGMRGSKVIVAVNTKKDAPIFKVATYGCVADLFTLVPLLTQEFKRLMA